MAFKKDGQDFGARYGLGDKRSSDVNIHVEMSSGQLKIKVCNSGGEAGPEIATGVQCQMGFIIRRLGDAKGRE